jgi:Rnl2 family RNA ligase
MFVKYSSITNSYDTKFINKIIQFGYDKLEWVVTCKIHGANFTFYTDGYTIRCASKNGFLGEGDKFFNYQKVLEKYHQRIIDVYRLVSRISKVPVLEIAVHGELFGGIYNHPDVPRVSGASKIQKGICYCPGNDFYLFDIKVDGKLCDYDFVTGISGVLGCPYAQELKRGTLQECLDYPNDFQDPTHKFYGLPTIDDNITEGVVIRPVDPLFIGAPEDEHFKRIILKNKNERFSEKAHAPKKIVGITDLSENVQAQIDHLNEFITENRLDNVISHFGEVQDKDFGKFIGEFSKDVWEEYFDEHRVEYAFLEDVEQKIVSKWSARLCANFLRPKFRQIVS